MQNQNAALGAGCHRLGKGLGLCRRATTEETSHCFKICDPGGLTANLGSSWSYPWRSRLCSLLQVHGDEPQTETHPTRQSFVSAGSASLLSCHASRQRAGNMGTAQVQGVLWAKQAPSRPRALNPVWFQAFTSTETGCTSETENIICSLDVTHTKGDRGLNPEYSKHN